MTNDVSAEAIQQRMAELRRELTTDVREVRQSAQKMANPLFYVRRYPWVSVGLAAAVGFALVPKRRQAVAPAPDVVKEMIRKDEINVDVSAGAKSQGLVRSLAVMGLTWGLRTGLNLMGQRLAVAVMNPQAAPPQHVRQPESTQQAETWKAMS